MLNVSLMTCFSLSFFIFFSLSFSFASSSFVVRHHLMFYILPGLYFNRHQQYCHYHLFIIFTVVVALVHLAALHYVPPTPFLSSLSLLGAILLLPRQRCCWCGGGIVVVVAFELVRFVVRAFLDENSTFSCLLRYLDMFVRMHVCVCIVIIIVYLFYFCTDARVFDLNN